MRKLKKIILLFFLTLLVLVLHFAIAYALPYPFDKINILFIYLILYLIVTESGTVVWLAFLTHIFIEIFPSTIFGVTLLSSSLAMLFSYWLYTYYITNRKWFSVGFLTFLTILFYRILYSFFLFFRNRFDETTPHIEWSQMVQLSFWEIILTTGLFTLIYFFFFRYSSKFYAIVRK